MNVDWSIRFGDVMQVGFFLSGLALAFFNLRQKVGLVEQRVSFLDAKFEEKADVQTAMIAGQSREIAKLGELLVSMARYEERLTAQGSLLATAQQQIEALRHGEGFINSPRLATAANP